MQLRRFSDPREFLLYAEAFLMEREAEHNLIFGLTNTLIHDPEVYPQFYLAVIEDVGNITLAAIRTPPHNLIISHVAHPDALSVLATDVRSVYGILTGVIATVPIGKTFADLWQGMTHQPYRLNMRERIYQLSHVNAVTGIPGAFRVATPDDRLLLIQWFAAFRQEAMGVVDNSDVPQLVDRYFVSETRKIYLWEHDGEVVSMAGRGGPTPNGIRIGPVYTPPEFRKKGYASACVAALSQLQLDTGRKFCFLYTDLSNPTSNHIYQEIGYEPICDVDEYRFDAPVNS
ncbi:MAG: GNAT family N-acetyltransferase [Anaerolineae bacterium]|nr:GNAT family N-acetyltransferase [Anaerolineae bacterium]